MLPSEFNQDIAARRRKMSLCEETLTAVFPTSSTAGEFMYSAGGSFAFRAAPGGKNWAKIAPGPPKLGPGGWEVSMQAPASNRKKLEDLAKKWSGYLKESALNEGREFNRFTVSFPTTKLRDAAIVAVLAKNPAMNAIASTFGSGSEIGAIFLLRTPEGEQFPRISDLANVLDKHQGKTLKKEIIKAVAEHRKLMVAFPSASKRDAAIALAKDMNPDMGISVSTLWPGAGPATKGAVFILRNPDQKISRLEALVAKYEGKIVKNQIESALSEGRYAEFVAATGGFYWFKIDAHEDNPGDTKFVDKFVKSTGRKGWNVSWDYDGVTVGVPEEDYQGNHINGKEAGDRLDKEILRASL